jgi:hypothetical protein
VAETHSAQEQKKRTIFDGLIERRWGTSINPPKLDPDDKEHDEYKEYEDDDEVARTVPEIEDSVDANGQLLNELPAYDKMSNIFFLLVLSDERFQEKMFAVTINEEEWYITSGMMMLWTVGGSVHASYDIMVWYIVACACCPFSKKFRLYGSFLVVFAIVMLLAMTSLIVLVRASLQHEENDNLDVMQLDSAGLVDDQVVLVDIKKEDVRFLLGYVTEFALALIVYYPLGSLVLFSGILGCGKLPILGGRPRDILVDQKMVKHREKIMWPSA